VFGKRSESWIAVEQTALFNEAEVLVQQGQENQTNKEDKIEVQAHTKLRGKRKPLPENLPREIVVIDILESEKKDAAGNTSSDAQ